MRRPRVRDPQSIWDIFAVFGVYFVLEYFVLQMTGEPIIRQEIAFIGILVLLWVIWATFHILDKAIQSE